MALDPLATTTDLQQRGITDGALDIALDVASSLVRDAAGCAISEETSTVVVTGTRAKLLGLPGPITDVSALTITTPVVIGYPVSPIIIIDFEILPNGLWRQCGWSPWGNDVAKVTVTYTHGLATIPSDLVDLTCNLAKAWLDYSAAGGGSMAGLSSVKLDDASEAYTAEAAGQVSSVFIPEATRDWLGRRFGSSVAVVEML